MSAAIRVLPIVVCLPPWWRCAAANDDFKPRGPVKAGGGGVRSLFPHGGRGDR
jgi:hypothetical protein